MAKWGQKQDPIEGTAIFAPDEPQSPRQPTTGAPRSPTSTPWAARSTPPLQVAACGQSNTTPTTSNAHVSADNRAHALTEGCASEAQCKSAEIAARLSTESVYSEPREEASELLETTGPEHEIKLESKLGSHEAGEEVSARQHTVYHYDEAAPATGGPYHLSTKVTQGALLASGQEDDVRETRELLRRALGGNKPRLAPSRADAGHDRP